MMADDWYEWRRQGEDVAMIAIRRGDVDDLNGRARRHREANGELWGPVLEVDERPYQAGDEIVCLRNDYRLGVRNGDRATVERVDPDGRTMRVRLDDGVRAPPAEYLDAGHVAHAYATTIHKAQGMTVDRCLTLGTDDLYREAGYVALSRGQHHQRPLRRRRPRRRRGPHPRNPTRCERASRPCARRLRPPGGQAARHREGCARPRLGHWRHRTQTPPRRDRGPRRRAAAFPGRRLRNRARALTDLTCQVVPPASVSRTAA